MTADATVEVIVRGLAAGGSGVAELPDGRVVFVPRTAPGDRARIRIEKEKARWAVGALVTLLEEGPERVEPPCSLYERCGGCQLQHLGYDRQLEWKGRFVADALTRIGGLAVDEPPEVVPSPRTVRYRNRITYTLRRLRGGRVVAGFHALGRPAHVLDVGSECVLPEPELSEAWTALRASWGGGARLLPEGGRLRLTLRARDPGVELLIEGGRGPWRSDDVRVANPLLTSVRHLEAHGTEAGSEDRRAGSLGPDADHLGGAFSQVNRAAAELLRAHVLEIAGAAGSAVDAYCGAGAFGHALAASGWAVSGIESDPAAVALAGRSAPESFRVVLGRAEEVLGAHLPTDLLLLNPPRSGLHPDVPAIVSLAPPERVVYVSCDPATLARDLAALGSGYELVGLRAFDLFPQTAHVETVAQLRARREES